MSRFIDAHRDRFGVEPICAVLQVAPSTYYARRSASRSERSLRDDDLAVEIARVHHESRGVYGARKVWRQLRRDGHRVARCTVERLMSRDGLQGVRRGPAWKTTRPDPASTRAPDLVDRNFTAPAPNRLWVADFTYVRTHAGFVYAAFVIDAFSRRIVGWSLARHMRTDLPLEALQMALWIRHGQPLDGLVCHSDAGSQYTAIRYTERLAAAGLAPSIGSVGDSYDNALAETTIGIYKTELVERGRPWRTADQLELATLEWIDWFNHRRLHQTLGYIPPAEHEQTHHRNHPPVIPAGTH